MYFSKQQFEFQELVKSDWLIPLLPSGPTCFSLAEVRIDRLVERTVWNQTKSKWSNLVPCLASIVMTRRGQPEITCRIAGSWNLHDESDSSNMQNRRNSGSAWKISRKQHAESRESRICMKNQPEITCRNARIENPHEEPAKSNMQNYGNLESAWRTCRKQHAES